MMVSANKRQYFNNQSEVVAVYKNKTINPMGDS